VAATVGTHFLWLGKLEASLTASLVGLGYVVGVEILSTSSQVKPLTFGASKNVTVANFYACVQK
jgi:hypothetical protein